MAFDQEVGHSLSTFNRYIEYSSILSHTDLHVGFSFVDGNEAKMFG